MKTLSIIAVMLFSVASIAGEAHFTYENRELVVDLLTAEANRPICGVLKNREVLEKLTSGVAVTSAYYLNGSLDNSYVTLYFSDKTEIKTLCHQD